MRSVGEDNRRLLVYDSFLQPDVEVMFGVVMKDLCLSITFALLGNEKPRYVVLYLHRPVTRYSVQFVQ